MKLVFRISSLHSLPPSLLQRHLFSPLADFGGLGNVMEPGPPTILKHFKYKAVYKTLKARVFCRLWCQPQASRCLTADRFLFLPKFKHGATYVILYWNVCDHACKLQTSVSDTVQEAPARRTPNCIKKRATNEQTNKQTNERTDKNGRTSPSRKAPAFASGDVTL